MSDSSRRAELLAPADLVVPLFGVTKRPYFRVCCRDCGARGLVSGFDPPSECYDCIERRVFDVPDCGFWVYRLWGIDSRLLYVGLTRNPKARINAHWNRWGPNIQLVTWEECDDEFDMLAREAHAINSEYPAFNIHHPGVT